MNEDIIAAAREVGAATDVLALGRHDGILFTRGELLRFAAIIAARTIPEGYKLVPVEPTPEMVGAMATTYATGKIREGRTEHATLGMIGAVDAYAAMLDAATSAAPQADAPARDDALVAEVYKALCRAFTLGQTYWDQADSESYSQNRKADETQARFKKLLADTIAAMQPAQRGQENTK